MDISHEHYAGVVQVEIGVTDNGETRAVCKQDFGSPRCQHSAVTLSSCRVADCVRAQGHHVYAVSWSLDISANGLRLGSSFLHQVVQRLTRG